MPAIHLSTGAVHYLDQGLGVPVVLLHANPGDHRDFDAVIPSLAQRHRVLALDWPGYGGSALRHPPEQATIQLFHDMLREFLAALALPPAIFIGNSVGGHVAVRLACERPELVRGLVLVAPGGFTPHNVLTRAFCRLQGSRLALSPRRFAGLYLKHRTAATDAMLERASTVHATPERLALNRALWRGFGKPNSDLRPVASGIQAPTLLMFGRHDPAIPAHKDGREAARCMPRSRFVALPCGHAPFAEVPHLFLDHVQAFLTDMTPQE